MDNSPMPERAGQICKIISDIPDMEAEEVYIVTEDPADLDPDDGILVVGLKDLQRNVSNPENAERITVPKSELVVVGEDLTSYVKSWNMNNGPSR